MSILENKNQSVQGHQNVVAGNDINVNIQNVISNFDTELKNIFIKETDRINNIVRELLPNGILNHKLNERVPFCARRLCQSLLELTIPFEVVVDIISDISTEIEKVKDEEISTSDLRRIVYNLLRTLDFSKYGEKISLWGEHYVRKYGNPDERIQIIMEEEGRVEYMSYEILEKKLIPDLYHKCYNSDIYEDLEKIGSKTLIRTISSEIIEKVRMLNLNFIRYSTLHKLSFDLAIQPPHHWFTEKSMKESHLDYNMEKAKKAYDGLDKKLPERDLKYFSIEFVEHSCAFILSLYSLFIGLGKLRPLITLKKYLEFSIKNSEDELLWEELPISNINDDLKSINKMYGLNKLQFILGKIQIQLNNVDKEYDNLKSNFDLLFDMITKLEERYKFLSNYINNIKSENDIKELSFKLFSYYHKIRLNINTGNLILSSEYVKYLGLSGKFNVRLGGIFTDEKEDSNFFLFNNSDEDTNYLIIVSNKKMERPILDSIIKKNNHIIHEEFISVITVEEFLSLTKANLRENRIIQLLKSSMI